MAPEEDPTGPRHRSRRVARSRARRVASAGGARRSRARGREPPLANRRDVHGLRRSRRAVCWILSAIADPDARRGRKTRRRRNDRRSADPRTSLAPGARTAPTAPNAPSAPQPISISSRIRRCSPYAETGSVLIRSTPADADVLVNGKPRGKTPLALRDLAFGSYTIRVARDGYVAEERTLQLTARRPATSTTINLRAAARPTNRIVPGLPAKAGDASVTAGGLNVQSRPAGARVFVNDRLAGSTPIAIPGLPAGPATVRIEMDGYRVWTTKVHVNAGEQTRVAASLERP